MGTRIDQAIGRLPNQYHRSINIINLIKALIARLEDGDDLLANLATMRWISTAEGVWLDEAGEIIGIERFYKPITEGVFTYKSSYPGTDDPAKGYSSLPGPPLGGRYMSKDGIFQDEHIDDDEYRIWIYVKAFVTGKGGTYNDIFKYIKMAFDQDTHVTLGGTRKIHVELTAPLTQSERIQLVKYAPTSSGVSMVITNWP
jgi:hypothetical protein